MNPFLACAMTVLIEAPFLALCGYRDRGAVAIIACTNIVTNLLLGLAMVFLPCGRTPIGLLILEALVVVGEYAIYARAFGRSRRLFLLTLAANALSCGIGLLLTSR